MLDFAGMSEKILVIDDDVDTLRLVGLMLQRQGYQISVANSGQQGLSKAAEELPDLILLDVMMPEMDGYEVARRLRTNPATTATPILMFTANNQLNDKVAGFESGADDYLTKPTHPSELQTHVKALLERIPRKVDTGSLHQKKGTVIGVLSARGGLGVTTLAMNVAANLFSRSKSDVVLAELVPGKGTLGMDLGLNDQKTLAGFLGGDPADVTRERVRDALIPHLSGVRLLLASSQPGDVHLTSQIVNYEKLVKRLSTLGRFVVLDLGSGLSPYAQKVIPLCNQLLVVLEGVPNSIVHTRALIDEIIKLGFKKEKLLTALNNRVRSDTQLSASMVQDQLDYPLTVTFTAAPELLTQATRMQTAAVLCQPDGVTAKQVTKLTDKIVELEAAR